MGNKLHAKRTNGYASIKEANRAAELRLLQRTGKISGLQEQVPYLLIPAQYDDNHKLLERKCEYFADFVYHDADGSLVVEDTKGYKHGATYELFVIKRKLMLEKYKIRINET